MSNIETLLHKLIKKSLIAKRTVDSNNASVGRVIDKGEIMIGNGIGPDHLTIDGVIDGYVLTKDDTTSVGAKWAKPPSLGSNNGLIYATGGLALTPDNHNHMITCNGTFSVVLPDTTGSLPVGTRFTVVNSCTNPADVTTIQTAAGATLVDKAGSSSVSVAVNVTNRAFIYYIGADIWRVHGQN